MTEMVALNAELPRYHIAHRAGVGSPISRNRPAAISRDTEISSGNCAVRDSRSCAWYAWPLMSRTRENSRSAATTHPTTWTGIVAGSTSREQAMMMIPSTTPEMIVVDSAPPQYRRKCRGSRATCLISRLPAPRLANGEASATSATAPANAPRPSGCSARATRTKYDAPSATRLPCPTAIHAVFFARVPRQRGPSHGTFWTVGSGTGPPDPGGPEGGSSGISATDDEAREAPQRSGGPAPPEDGGNGLGENLQIESERPPVDVLQVEHHPAVECQIAAPADLPEPRHARRHTEPPHEPRLGELVDVAHRQRSRPHERHVAPHHVEELRQLVERHPPQQPPHTRDPGIVADLEHRARRLVARLEIGLQRLRSVDHRAEFVHREPPLVQPEPLLAEDHRARSGQLDRDHDDQHHRRRQYQPHDAADQIHRALHQHAVVVGHHVHPHDREPARLLIARPPQRRLEHVREIRRPHAQPLAQRDRVLDLAVARLDGQRDQHVVDHVAH